MNFLSVKVHDLLLFESNFWSRQFLDKEVSWKSQTDTIIFLNEIYKKLISVISKEEHTAVMTLLLAVCTAGCENGGVCVAPETCQCRKGFYGDQCQLGKDKFEPSTFSLFLWIRTCIMSILS